MTLLKLKSLSVYTVMALLPIALVSCAQEPNTYLTTNRYVVPTSGLNTSSNRVLLNAYSYQQTTNYTCGPAVVMSLLQHYGMLTSSDMNKTTEMRIASEMGSSSSGTSQTSMVSWLENHGFSVQSGQDVSIEMLLENLRHHTPVIIVWNDWNAHAMMVVGYYQQGSTTDNDKDVLFFVDPSTSSDIVENNRDVHGINTLSPSQLTFNQFNSRYFFNPSHTAPGLYIIAVPKAGAGKIS